MGNPMKKYTILILTILCIMFTITPDIFSQQKLAQTGFKFLSVSTDARVAGMADAVTSLYGSSTSMLYNPAGMADLGRTADVSFGNFDWIADINYTQFTAAFNPFDDYYGIFGVSVISVDYGNFQGTIRADNDAGYLDTQQYSPSALSVGLSYARSLSQKFSIGGSVKYVRQTLIDNGIVALSSNGGYDTEKFEQDAVAFDFGLIYRTGWKSLNIGMSVRNFAAEVTYIEDGFELPLLFKLGASVDAMDIFDIDKSQHSFVVSVDALHPRDFSEQILVGGEYTFLETLSLRAGYISPTDEAGLSLGIGLKQDLQSVFLSVDYAYSEFGIFGNLHRWSVSFAF
jgi:hypothetical protein